MVQCPEDHEEMLQWLQGLSEVEKMRLSAIASVGLKGVCEDLRSNAVLHLWDIEELIEFFFLSGKELIDIGFANWPVVYKDAIICHDCNNYRLPEHCPNGCDECRSCGICNPNPEQN